MARQRGAAKVPGYGTSYAMGWFVHPLYADPKPVPRDNSYTLPLVLDHEGETTNYRSVMAMLPGLRRGAVVLMNTSDGTIPGRYSRIAIGVEQILAGEPVSPPDVFTDNPLSQFGRLLLAAALLAELAWIGSWCRWRRGLRRLSGRRRAIARVLTLAGYVVILGGMYFLWFAVPGMFDQDWAVLPREVPDIGLLMVAFTAVGLARLGARIVLRARASAT